MRRRITPLLVVALSVTAPATLAAQGLSAYNVLTFRDFTQTNTEVNGRLAVGGSYRGTNSSVGTRLSAPAPTGALVVQGDATISGGSVFQGLTYIGGARTVTSATVTGLQAAGTPLPIDFVAEYARLSTLSDAYSALAPTAVATNQWGQLWFLGTDAQVNVFTIDAATLAAAGGGYHFYAPTTSTIVVNVTGFAGRTVFASTGFNFCTGVANATQFTGCSQVNTDNPGGLSSRLLWNFNADAETSMSFGGSMVGSVLAPNVNLSATWGACNGTFVLRSVSSQCEFYMNDFQGFVPQAAAVVVPEPGSFALTVVGLGVLGVAGRRRRGVR